jgi:hypothetical protein
MKKEFLLFSYKGPYIAVHRFKASCGHEVAALGSLGTLGIELATSQYGAVEEKACHGRRHSSA